jgi:hypothetical protein
MSRSDDSGGTAGKPLSLWEREGPIAERWEGEGFSVAGTLTRLAALATLSQREREFCEVAE